MIFRDDLYIDEDGKVISCSHGYMKDLKLIAESHVDRAERVRVRRRQLDLLLGSAIGKVVCSQRRWRRPDLVGRPVSELSCVQYWPAETGMA